MLLSLGRYGGDHVRKREVEKEKKSPKSNQKKCDWHIWMIQLKEDYVMLPART